MAVKELEPIKAAVNTLTEVTLVAATSASDGFKFKMPRISDEYVVVIVRNTHATAAKNVTIKAPTKGGYAAVTSDLTESLAAGEERVFRLESARYANNDGTVVIIPASTDITAAVIY